jgi:DMSO/TMAO reductase YedYZ molybdopterin-dependent catalytic subunit
MSLAPIDTAPASPPAGRRGGEAPARRTAPLRGAVAGSLAAAAALGVAELSSGVLAGSPSPVVAVGNWVVDHVPPAVKTFAIRTFGSNDKRALIVGTVIMLGVAAVLFGIVATRRPRAGIAGVATFGLLGAAAAMTRPDAPLWWALPSVLGAIAGMVALWALVGRRPGRASGSRADAAAPATRRTAPPAADRRRFLVTGAGVVALTLVSGGTGIALKGRRNVAGQRAALRLPAPASGAAALPAGVDLGTVGLEPFLTPNRDFYRVDTALVVPQISPDDWHLAVDGLVDRRLELDFDDLLSRRLVERDLTLVCVSNEVGGHLAGTARWLGVPLADLLREAGVQPGANQLVSRSRDGFTAGTPVDVVLDGRDALVAVGMNGEPLPVEHGFPARLIVPGLYGYVSATKWLTSLELTTFDAFDAYWVRRGWAQQAPIKTFARIDTPRGLAKVAAGPVPVAGVAWAVDRGIDGVEVRVDDGPWQPARLGAVPGRDTWRQWVFDWSAPPGRHTLTVRATDGTGAVQTEERAPPIPDGASGWHSIVVIAS